MMGDADQPCANPVTAWPQSVTVSVTWPDRPDLELVESLAKLTLAVRRLGGQVRFSDVPRDLAELFRFAALAELLQPGADGGVGDPTVEDRPLHG